MKCPFVNGVGGGGLTNQRKRLKEADRQGDASSAATPPKVPIRAVSARTRDHLLYEGQNDGAAESADSVGRKRCRRLATAKSSPRAFPLIILLALILHATVMVAALKCLDCVGRDCMGSFCEDGDYCVLAHYAPRWGTIEWGESRVVKGCASGSMLRKDVRDHCETSGDDGEEPFTCFCNGKDYCNGDKAVERLDVEPVQLLTCACEGSHCTGKTCIGELCSYVINHKTKQREQGCVNASVPLVERRSSGACMIPPITGAMHHTVARTADDLLVTESCVCGTDYCNVEKPEPRVAERMKCQTFVRAEVMGTKMVSRNVSCEGEFCFKAKISSRIGHMSKYSTIGCASFIDDYELAEEMNPTGCAKFKSENVEVEACMQTTDKRAIARAKAALQRGVAAAAKASSGGRRPSSKSRGKGKSKMELSYEDEEEEERSEEKEEEKEEEEKEEKGRRKAGKSRPKALKSEEDENRRKPGEDTEEEDEEETEEEREEEGEDSGRKTTTLTYIFERPTLPPEPEDSNAALVSVFLCLILLIALSGVVWKFQLHKRLFRASYDSVAGG